MVIEGIRLKNMADVIIDNRFIVTIDLQVIDAKDFKTTSP